MAESKKSYQEILQEIDALKAQAEAVRKAEIAAVIEDVRAKVRAYNLTARDLGLSAEQGRGTRQPSAPKYRDPVSGKTWTGRGVHPTWLKDYIAQGRSKEEFMINS